MSNLNFNILIVEDEAIVAVDLAARLNNSGYHVIGISDNYDEAIAVFKEFKPDLVLLDVTIKGNKTGIDIATSINEILPTPFIFITANTDADTIGKAKNTFPSAYMVKPFTTSHLLISVELAIHNFAYQKKVINAETKITESISEEAYAKQDYLFIKEGYFFIKIYQQDILFIEAQDNYIKIFTKQKNHLIRCSLNKIMERLNNSFITRLHRSFSVNINLIDSFCDNEVKIKDHSIPVGRNYKADFIQNFVVK